MAIYIIIALILISFWTLGYIYQRGSGSISIERRQITMKMANLKNKIDSLKKEKDVWMKKIKELEEEIEKVKEDINRLD